MNDNETLVIKCACHGHEYLEVTHFADNYGPDDQEWNELWFSLVSEPQGFFGRVKAAANILFKGRDYAKEIILGHEDVLKLKTVIDKYLLDFSKQ